jgi:hypothetical protein
MVYANGSGAPRRIDVALRLACTTGDTVRIMRLDELRTNPQPTEDFNICNDAGSTIEINACAWLEEELKAQQRAAKLATLTAAWAPNEKVAFSGLEHSANAFFKTREQDEVDLTGTARTSMQIEERATLRDGFLAAIESFESGKLPNMSAQESAEAQNAERRTFAATQKSLACGTISSAGINRTEQIWRRYAAAWTTLASFRYPSVKPDAFRGWLAEERRKMLEELVGCGG